MITGSVLGFSGVMINNVIWPHVLPALKSAYPETTWLANLPETFWLDGARMFFFACLAAICMYVLFSLMTKQPPDFDIDKLLNRGKFARPEDVVRGTVHATAAGKLIGISDEYTLFDKFIAISLFVWTLFWFAVFVIGTIIGFLIGISEEQWITYWIITQSIYIAVGVITVVWFLIGGFRDLAQLFRDLKGARRNDLDDGIVRDSQEQDALVSETTLSPD